jgi:hypothetical protein
MPDQSQPEIEFEHDDFDCADLDDELRVDQLCQSLLKRFYQHLQTHGHTPQKASDLAYSADLYLRDYVLDFACQNVVRPRPNVVKRFAATWYITHTLDPEIGILEGHLAAIRELYRFLNVIHLISADELVFLLSEAADIDFYRHRIESFLAIQTDGYISWEAECPPKD